MSNMSRIGPWWCFLHSLKVSIISTYPIYLGVAMRICLHSTRPRNDWCFPCGGGALKKRCHWWFFHTFKLPSDQRFFLVKWCYVEIKPHLTFFSWLNDVMLFKWYFFLGEWKKSLEILLIFSWSHQSHLLLVKSLVIKIHPGLRSSHQSHEDQVPCV